MIIDIAFNKTIHLLKRIKYARYTPLLYIIPSKQKEITKDRKSGQENARGFIKGMLVKRLESSIYAFNESIKRIAKSQNDFLKMYEEDKIVIGNMSRNNKFDTDYLISLSDDEFEELISERDLIKINKADLVSDFEKDLKSDIAIFNELKELLANFDIENDDAKYDILVSLLKELKKKNNPMVYLKIHSSISTCFKLNKNFK